MREVIATGRTVEEATENGCRELGLSRSEVSVEILQMSQKKLFKTIPAQVKVTSLADIEAREEAEKAALSTVSKIQENSVEKTINNTEEKQQAASKPEKAVLPTEPEVEIDLSQNLPAASAVAYLSEIFTAMGAESVAITAVQQGDATLLRVEGDSLSNVLETRGEVVQALSYLTDRSVNKGVDKKDANYLRIRLDIAGYRGRRESELVSLATRAGKEVQKTHRSRTLSPMNPYERLIVHTTISGMDGLYSESIGTDSERRVVIKSNAPDATDGEDWRPPRRGGNNRGGRGGNSRGRSNNNNRERGNNNRSRGPRPDAPRTSTPQREYADKPQDPNAQPIVPERRETIRDGEDLPLYGKIEI